MKKTMTRNIVIMAIVTVIMAVVLSLYIKNTGTVPAADNTASLADAKPGEQFQFVRTGFFTPDSKNPGVYNRVVTLRDSFKPAK